jgi:hypothetical protein
MKKLTGNEEDKSIAPEVPMEKTTPVNRQNLAAKSGLQQKQNPAARIRSFRHSIRVVNRLRSMKQTKYDWSKAPEWAQWAAIDNTGVGYWYEFRPVFLMVMWGKVEGMCEYMATYSGVNTYYSSESLEKRPQ